MPFLCSKTESSASKVLKSVKKFADALSKSLNSSYQQETITTDNVGKLVCKQMLLSKIFVSFTPVVFI